MAYSLFSNTVHVCFDSVLAMDNPGMLETEEEITDVSRPDVGDQEEPRVDEMEHWFNLSYEEFFASDANRRVETASDTDEESKTVVCETVVTEPEDGTDKDLGTDIADVVPATVEKKTDDESLSLEETFHRMDALNPTELYAKEEMVLSWAGTDSTRVALQQREYILLKFRELLLRKFFTARRGNFISYQPSTATDIKVLQMLSKTYLSVLAGLICQRECIQQLGIYFRSECIQQLGIYFRSECIQQLGIYFRSECIQQLGIYFRSECIQQLGIYFRNHAEPLGSLDLNGAGDDPADLSRLMVRTSERQLQLYPVVALMFYL
ncbi:hypothetical protein F511_18141 [Dorcoceras hygrometricum]|uniref:Uncharacterized protein n=1 Tax=Dorcoceras hygrometricum TaxID=472368 RepID=A0A2Z7A7Y5_9LAMI|nr:hypothetical protein F511_18141 [Dorcoceras hygrometricum]